MKVRSHRESLKRRWAYSILVLGLVAGVYWASRSLPPSAPVALRPAQAARDAHVQESFSPTERGPVAPVVTGAPIWTTLSGRVQTEAGGPLAGANVCAAEANGDCCNSMSCTESDADGRFVLSNSGAASTLFASRVGYAPLTQTVGGRTGAAPLVLTMHVGGARVTGSVADASGGPIIGALLSASNQRGDVLALGVSDSGGHFRLDLASGMTRVSVRADGYSRQEREILAPLQGVQFVLAAASSIVGRVLAEETLAPVADVLVTASGQDGPRTTPSVARTAEDGTFRLSSLPAGRYSLVAVSEHWRSEEHLLALGVADVTEPVELMVREAAQLRGVVRVGAVPCRQGSVTLQGAVQAFAPVEEDGRVVFDGISPGRYQVSVTCEGALDTSEALEIDLTPVTRVWSLDEGLRLTGVALTQGGAPVARAQIDVSPVGEPIERSATRCMTGGDGRFSCSGLVAGDYECTIGPGVPPRSDRVRVAVSSESAPDIVLREHAEGTIRVRIENAERFELPALLLLAQGNEEAVLGELHGDEFVFEALALGVYEVLSDSERPGSGRRVELTRAGEVAELRLTLPAAHAISGRVVDDAGQGIPDAWVRASGTSEYAHIRAATPVLTDSGGAFSLQGLLPGRYRLTAVSGGGEAQVEGVASDSDAVLVHLSTYGSLSGSLESATGDAVPDFILAYAHTRDGSETEITGSRGHWSLPWLAPGTYRLTAKAAEGTTTQMVELPSGGEVTLGLRLDSATLEPRPNGAESARSTRSNTGEELVPIEQPSPTSTR